MTNEKDIKIEPYQAFFQIGFKYGKKEGTVVITNDFYEGVDVHISDRKGDFSKDEENKIMYVVLKKFLKNYSEKMERDMELLYKESVR